MLRLEHVALRLNRDHLSLEKICASDDQKLKNGLVLKSGEAPVHPDCFTAEQ